MLFQSVLWIHQPKIESEKNLVWYHIYVPSFYDSNGDGIGDLKGIEQQLNYLQQLGVDGIILSPVYDVESVSNPTAISFSTIDSMFGTIADLKNLVDATHQRHMKIIMSVDVNGISTSSITFQKSVEHESLYYQYFNWSDNEKNNETNGWYWPAKSRFNEKYFSTEGVGFASYFTENDAVRYEIITAFRDLLTQTGIDGYEATHVSETVCMNKPNNADGWWTLFCNYLLRANENCILISDSYLPKPPADYKFFNGFIDSVFSTAMRNAVATADASALNSLLKKVTGVNDSTYSVYFFLNNNLSSRINSVFSDVPEKALLAKSILLTLPVNIEFDQGDEIGMYGDAGVKSYFEPFLWNVKHADAGQTHWEKNKQNHVKKVLPLSVQQKDSTSAFSVFKELLSLRKQNLIFSDGHYTDAGVWQKQILGYRIENGNQKILVLHNLSSTTQQLELTGENFGMQKIIWQSDFGVFTANEEISLPPFASVMLTTNY